MTFCKLRPACKDYIWGGTNLKTEWNKVSDTERLAETWELSFHPAGPSVIAEGEGAGKLLKDVAAPAEYGTNCRKFPFFPVLVKLIDAADDLSVQVHPDDTYALREEGQFGKTEMWYICGCEPGAGIYRGFKRQLSPEEYAERIASGTIADVLEFIEVRPGESYLIPAGTVHAIGKGTTICEIQQNSDLTYRVYDYGRKGADGRPRELHIEKAKQVSALGPCRTACGEVRISEHVRRLASCPYFTVYEIEAPDGWILRTDDGSFSGLTVIGGEGAFESDGERFSFRKGDTFFAPAGRGEIVLRGGAKLLLTRTE